MREHLHRLFRAELDVDDDTGTVTGRVVPYDEPAHIVDGDGEYDEVFTAASFLPMLQGFARAGGTDRPERIRFDLDHRPDLASNIGVATRLESAADGLYGTFRLHDDPPMLPKIRSMLRSSHTGLSIDCAAGATRIRDNGVRERLRVHMYAVAATPTPAYAGAKILAVRHLTDVEPPDASTPRLDAAVARWATVLPSFAQTQ